MIPDDKDPERDILKSLLRSQFLRNSIEVVFEDFVMVHHSTFLNDPLFLFRTDPKSLLIPFEFYPLRHRRKTRRRAADQ
jgi:hypothetical protein